MSQRKAPVDQPISGETRTSSFLFGLGGSSGISLFLVGSLLLGLLVLDVLGDELLVGGGGSLGSLSAISLGLLDDLLSADTLLSNQSLDLWSLVVGLVTLGDGAVVHISAHIVGLVEVEVGSDVGSSLLGETVGLGGVGEAGDLLLTLLDDVEGNNGKIWSDNASTDGLSLSLSSSSWLVKSAL